MKRYITSILIFIIFFLISLNVNAELIIEERPLLNKNQVNKNKELEITPVAFPGIIKESKININIRRKNKGNDLFSNNELRSVNEWEILAPGEYVNFKINTDTETIDFEAIQNLIDPLCYDAIDEVPEFMRKDLLLKFRLLEPYNWDDNYAQMILDADSRYKDEIAFCIATMPVNQLADKRFTPDMELLVRNAEYIYRIQDSLKYVRVNDYGIPGKDDDYYTTTEYKIRDGQYGEIKWVEIPKEIYYWYVVHPKMYQEGVYSLDEPSNDEQRTYDYFFKEYYWSNPNPNYDYTGVDITTSKGSVETIPRFGELMQNPEILWTRTKGYFEFGREFDINSFALDLIGNWASQAVPINARAPRAFQPNQVVYEHNGNCNEDTYIIVAACRAALIPAITCLGSGEDHVWGNIYDEGWHHFEFFRGGLDPVGNQFYGITSMLDGGSYSWTTSFVSALRPDGYTLKNFTQYYNDLAQVSFKITDKNGNPVDGANVTLYCSPGPYNSQIGISTYLFTDENGMFKADVGVGKTYLIQVYHEDFGYIPNKDQAIYVTNGAAVKDRKYEGEAKFEENNNTMPEINIADNVITESSADYGIDLAPNARTIQTGRSSHDFHKSRFFKWADESDTAILDFMILSDSELTNFRAGKPFQAYNYSRHLSALPYLRTLPGNGKWNLVVSNSSMTNDYVHVNTNLTLLSDALLGIDDNIDNSESIFPNPFESFVDFNVKDFNSVVEIYDINSRLIKRISKAPYIWKDPENVNIGVYMVKIIDGKGNIRTDKIIKK